MTRVGGSRLGEFQHAIFLRLWLFRVKLDAQTGFLTKCRYLIETEPIMRGQTVVVSVRTLTLSPRSQLLPCTSLPRVTGRLPRSPKAEGTAPKTAATPITTRASKNHALQNHACW